MRSNKTLFSSGENKFKGSRENVENIFWLRFLKFCAFAAMWWGAESVSDSIWIEIEQLCNFGSWTKKLEDQ